MTVLRDKTDFHVLISSVFKIRIHILLIFKIHSKKVLSSHFWKLTYLSKNPIEKGHSLYSHLFLVSYLLGEKKINNIQLKSFWHDLICGPIKISVLRMRVALMMFYQMIITKTLLIK